ncbi:MAG: hypothetical protein E6R02_00845 [Gammaproteobacteria bacterium]|nr:MAG: hypothetical protein E6R02_00845 [Gammaproteobacteria bacterium]
MSVTDAVKAIRRWFRGAIHPLAAKATWDVVEVRVIDWPHIEEALGHLRTNTNRVRNSAPGTAHTRLRRNRQRLPILPGVITCKAGHQATVSRTSPVFEVMTARPTCGLIAVRSSWSGSATAEFGRSVPSWRVVHPTASAQLRRFDTMSMRDTIHEVAVQAGWAPALGTEVATNVRVYQRGKSTLLLGYTPNGGATGLSELVETENGIEQRFEVPYRDKDKATQIIAWLKTTAS